MLTDVLYALSKHHLVKYLTATQTYKAVYTVSTCTMRQRPTISRFVHLWHLAILERRDIIPSEVLIESRAGYWSYLSGLPESMLIEFKQKTKKGALIRSWGCRCGLRSSRGFQGNLLV